MLSSACLHRVEQVMRCELRGWHKVSCGKSSHVICVVKSRGSQVPMREQLQPLTDDLIQRCMSTGPWEYNGKPLWHRILDFAMDAGEHKMLQLPSETQKRSERPD